MPYTYTNTMKTKTITVHVTEELIEAGVRGDCSYCPVALALHAAGVRGASTTGAEIEGYFVPAFPAPFEVLRFVRNFDKGKLALPFNFTITIVL